MSREDRLRTETIIYWARSGVGDDGEVTLAAYNEIKAQWVEQRTEAADSFGNMVMVDVQIVVGRELVAGSIVAKGIYADYSSGDLLYEVVTYGEQRDLKNRFIRRVAGLRRYGTELPELAS